LDQCTQPPIVSENWRREAQIAIDVGNASPN